MTTRFGLSSIGQIHVPVRDLDRATAFYREELGMEFLFQAPPGMSFFRCGEVTLLLGTAEAPEHDHPSSILYFLVEDIESAHRTLAERGVAFREGPHRVHRAEDHELWLAFFRDSEDNTLALMARRAIGARDGQATE